MAVKSKSTQYLTVTGITTVNHQIRLKLSLSMADYAILSMIENLKGKQVTDSISWKLLGVTLKVVTERMNFLYEKGFLDKDFKVTSKWTNAFLPDEAETKFNELWEIFQRTGNKKNAKSMFIKALKAEDYNVLLENAKKYISYCRETRRFIMHMSSWLNPDFRHWEDELHVQQKEESIDRGPIKKRVYNG